MSKALGSGAATRSVRATVRGATVPFSGVQVASLAAFAKALLGVKLPTADTKKAAPGKGRSRK